ncbi:MAG: 50S ribosome-binding GTPase [Planctomycetota bacterium]|nr:50S ribosome-binding GTPase [Planctomycetota bacterium]
MNLEDTIVAVSSPAGAGERAILRLSGPQALEIAAWVFVPAENPAGPYLAPREYTGGRAREGEPVDVRPPVYSPGAKCGNGVGLEGRSTYTAIAGRLEPPGSGLSVPATLYVMKGPRSYTRQDVVEFHVGAWPALEGDLVAGLLAAGARPAEAGEFTFRAFASGRLDLAQAEAVAAVISASSAAALRAAEDLLGGHLSREVAAVAAEVRECLALVEADLDFSDQDIELTPPEELAGRIDAARASLAALGRRARGLETAGGRVRLVVAGRPNTGKSSLFNRLLECERAIVSPEAGTTRDELRAALHIGGIEFALSDIAGLDDTLPYLAPREYTRGGASQAPVNVRPPVYSPGAKYGEQPRHDVDIAVKAREKALEAIGRADLVLLTIDGSAQQHDRFDELMALIAAPVVVAITKCDLASVGLLAPGGNRGSPFEGNCPPALRRGLVTAAGAEVIATSAVTGQGIEELRAALVRAVAGGDVDRQAAGPVLTARHRSALEAAAGALARAAGLTRRGGEAGELAALELREALESLGAIVGQGAGPDLLDLVFSRFCIGK